MKRVTVNDIEIAYEEIGSGTPLLLVHGFPLDHTMWLPIAQRLSDRCRLILPDLRGYGDSTLGEVDPAAGVAMGRYAEDLAGLVDAIGVDEQIILGGFSMGGYIAWQFIRQHGDRLRGLALCDTKATADVEPAREMRLKMASHVAEWGAERVAEAMLPKLFAKASLDAGLEAVDQTRRVIAGADPRAIAAAQLGMAARPDMTELLPGIDLPAAVVVGEEDQLSTPEEMRGMAEAMPQAELTVVAGAGHMAPVENPAAVAAAIERLL